MFEKWYVKENGGEGSTVGIASSNSDWFIAENVLEKHAKLICELFNSRNEERESNEQ